MKLLIIILLCFAAFGIDAADNNVPVNNNQNAGNAIENLLNMIGKLVTNQQTAPVTNQMDGYVNFITQVLKSFNIGDAQNSNRTTEAITDLLKLVGDVLPDLGKGAGNETDINDLIGKAVTFFTTNADALSMSGVSAGCKADVNRLFTGLQNLEGWAWKMLDSVFKPESGIADLNNKWLGSRPECLAVVSNATGSANEEDGPFTGKYCRVVFPVPVAKYVLIGTCASNRCSNDDVTTLVKSAMSLFSLGQLTNKQEVVTACEEEKELDSGAKVAIAILSILAALVFFGTLYDVIVIQLGTCDNGSDVAMVTKPNPKPPSYDNADKLENGVAMTNIGYVAEPNESNGVEKKYIADDTKAIQAHVTPPVQQNTKPTRSLTGNILLAFSAYTNGCKLLGTNQGSGSLGAINGIRFLSMAWVILGHSVFFASEFMSNSLRYTSVRYYRWTFMAFLGASVSVDSFFALSGTLVAYLTLREMKKVGGPKRLNWFMFYFHRFWRLTPPYMLVLMAGTTLYKYIGNGAMKPEGDLQMMEGCRDNWWTNLLYVNNYVNTDRACMGWSWYLANDMQLYVISPVFLVPLFLNAIFGGILSAVSVGLAIFVSAFLAYQNNYLAQGVPEAGPQDQGGFKNFYIPVWTRFGPYLVGLVTGYILYRTKCKCKIPKAVNIGCWIVCLASICAIVYGPYSDHDSHIFSKAESVTFNGMFRTSWGFCICWIIFACATGNGGWINTLLSWSPFIPLGRLTYCAYLLHPLVMTMYYDTRDVTFYFTDYSTIYIFLGNMCLSYGVSFVASLFIESPMMGLEKAIFKKK